MARLILIEGFPGGGKSTTAQFLARLLARRGARARWICEAEVPNPLVPPVPAGDDQSWEQFVEMRVARWRAFAAAAIDHDATVVPESALLQLPVFTLLRRNVETAVITELIGRLVEAVAPLRPTLIYLTRRDPETALRALGESRGLSWLLHHAGSSDGFPFTQARGLSGFDGLFAYWRAHAELCDTIVKALDVPKLVLDVDAGGWPERRRQICDFVDVPFEDDAGRRRARANRGPLPGRPARGDGGGGRRAGRDAHDLLGRQRAPAGQTRRLRHRVVAGANELRDRLDGPRARLPLRRAAPGVGRRARRLYTRRLALRGA